jgi:hypothetical protein
VGSPHYKAVFADFVDSVAVYTHLSVVALAMYTDREDGCRLNLIGVCRVIGTYYLENVNDIDRETLADMSPSHGAEILLGRVWGISRDAFGRMAMPWVLERMIASVCRRRPSERCSQLCSRLKLLPLIPPQRPSYSRRFDAM